MGCFPPFLARERRAVSREELIELAKSVEAKREIVNMHAAAQVPSTVGERVDAMARYRVAQGDLFTAERAYADAMDDYAFHLKARETNEVTSCPQ